MKNCKMALLVLGLIGLLGSCASTNLAKQGTKYMGPVSTSEANQGSSGNQNPSPSQKEGQGLNEQSESQRLVLVESARKLLGKKPNAKVTIKGKTFVLDCIGTVSAAFWDAGMDIQRDFNKFSGNGVNRLFESLRAWGALNIARKAQLGDIVIWDNTWDRNEDGKYYNDGPTHAGIVVAVDDDGTVTYLHEDYVYGVVLAYMNLEHPDVARSPEGKTWNTALMMGASKRTVNKLPRWLSGDLWSGYGDLELTQSALKPQGE